MRSKQKLIEPKRLWKVWLQIDTWNQYDAQVAAIKKLKEREKEMVGGGGVTGSGIGGGAERKSAKPNGQTKVGDRNGTVLKIPTLTPERLKELMRS